MERRERDIENRDVRERKKKIMLEKLIEKTKRKKKRVVHAIIMAKLIKRCISHHFKEILKE